MKKGCLFRSIILITIFVAIVLYFFQQKFGDLINLPNKEFVISFLKTDINKKLNFVKDSPQKINFEKMIENARSGLDLIKGLSTDQINDIRDKFDDIFSDSIITQKELNYVRELFKKLKK